MKLALLGADPRTLELLRGIAEDRQHQLAGAYDLGGYQDEVVKLFPGVTLTRQWESFLDETVADAVIVARGPNEDERAEQLRKLVQVTMPVIAAHPIVESMLVYYELDMIRREYRAAIVPDLPERHHPAIARAADWFQRANESPIGAVEQIVFERSMRSRGRREVTAQFARDVDLVRSIVGDLTKMAALGTTEVEAAYSTLGIQMSGPAGVVCRWSVGPAEQLTGGRMTLVGLRGKAIVSIPDQNSADDAAWHWESSVGGQTITEDWLEWDPAAVTMANLTAAMQNLPHQPDWVDAARSVEMAESIDRCLKKGRTVELYNETYTEAGTFKGTMTTLGCGLLIAGIGLALFAAVLQQVARALGWDGLAELTRNWPYFLLGVLVAFLVLQFALKLAAGWTKPDEPAVGADDVRT